MRLVVPAPTAWRALDEIAAGGRARAAHHARPKISRGLLPSFPVATSGHLGQCGRGNDAPDQPAFPAVRAEGPEAAMGDREFSHLRIRQAVGAVPWLPVWAGQIPGALPGVAAAALLAGSGHISSERSVFG